MIRNQESQDRPRRHGERGIFERPAGSNIWWIRFADKNGRIRRQKVGPKGLAKRLYEKRKTQVREGKFFPELLANTKGPTFAEAMDDYITRKEPIWKSSKEWKRIGEKWKERFKGRDLSGIERADIEQEISTLARRLKRGTVNRLKPGTVNRHVTLLKAFLHDAMINGELAADPACLVKKLREDNERVRFLSEAEQQRLIDTLPPKYRSVVRFAILTGMRRGEVFNLQWRDIDFATRNMTVREPKEGRIKCLPMSQAVYDLLVGGLPHQSTEHASGDRVFAFDPHNFVNRVFIPAVRRAEIQDFRFHDLRHTFATRLIMKGST
jgi:integrase